LTIDTIFPPPGVEELVSMSKKTMIPDNPLESNKYELIFDEIEEGR
jgi:hypothetical protein